MINTDWEDDGEAINAAKWYCDAWAAECAWNASTTPLESFNRRLGSVLFGESGGRFGQAIGLLSKTHGMAGMHGMNNRRFWEVDFAARNAPADVEAQANRLLAVVTPAVESLEALKKEAVANQNVIDACLFGARRMELIGRRMLDGLVAARLYERACAAPVAESLPLVGQVETLVRRNRDAHEAAGRQFAALWLSESEPYALDWTMARYAKTVKEYDALLARLSAARGKVASGHPLPTPKEIGLELPESLPHRARPGVTAD